MVFQYPCRCFDRVRDLLLARPHTTASQAGFRFLVHTEAYMYCPVSVGTINYLPIEAKPISLTLITSATCREHTVKGSTDHTRTRTYACMCVCCRRICTRLGFLGLHRTSSTSCEWCMITEANGWTSNTDLAPTPSVGKGRTFLALPFLMFDTSSEYHHV